MAKKATTRNRASLEAVLRRLNPNVPAGQTGDAIPRIPRDSTALRQIRAHLGADPFAKMLLTGHIGVGKSTELLHFAREMEANRWVIQCSVASTLGVHNVNTFSLLVVLLEASIRSWVKRLGEISPGLVGGLVDLVRKLVPEETRPAKLTPLHRIQKELLEQVDARALLAGKPTLRIVDTGWALLNLYDEILQRLALRSVSVEQAGALDPSPLALSCELILKELENEAGKPVLLVIDDLDKVRSEEARDDVFLNRAMAWLRLPCGIVSTLPLDALFSSRGRELDEVWFDVQVLDPLPVPAADGGTLDDPALQPYLSILRSVGAEGVLSALQCRRLANASSGLPRTFVSACSACVAYAVEADEVHVRDYHVDLVLRDIADRWRGRLDDSDYRALIDVLDSEGSNVPRAISLLRDGILVRDGTAPPERQFRLASWAEPLVEAYRRRMLRKQSTPS
ncbi:MAG: hypothetical protein ABIP48_07375 [Planctomycetota bacterium]